MLGAVGAGGRRPNAFTEETRREREIGDSEIASHAKSVSIVTGTLHPVYLRSQAQLMAQPSGDLVQRCRASRAEAGQLSVGRIAERTPARLYRLLQQDDGQTLSVDLHRQAIDHITNCP